jgi:hypothetical protein
MNDTNRPWHESWKDIDDPRTLFTRQAERSSDRKCWLFLCALIREHRYLLSDALSRQAYFVLERYAEGRVSGEELRRSESRLRLSLQSRIVGWTDTHQYRIARATELLSATLSCAVLQRAALDSLAPLPDIRTPILNVLEDLTFADDGDRQAWKKRPVALLLDIFGPPFATPALEAGWRQGPGKQAAQLALSIYEGPTFEDLPILADALLDADCPNPDLIDHCQTPGVHGRGCWAVDSLLARG